MQTWVWIGQSAFDTLLLINIVVIWFTLRRLPTRIKSPSDLSADISVLESKAFQLEKEMEHYRKRVWLQINALNHICETANHIIERSRSKNPLANDFMASTADRNSNGNRALAELPAESTKDSNPSKSQTKEASATIHKIAHQVNGEKDATTQDWAINSDDLLRQQLG